ncbi:GntR family transcriptional regulator [Streptomyces xiamenensis]|uniref:GntR family transcriptional regulator n=1 Tax=Streptomyces xiamenensis TaxID=408015 RepID=UPI00367F7DF5
MHYRIERRRGVAAYQQIVEQTKRALRTGALRVGDRLPTAREVAETSAVNPNTTLKAYRELEREGIVELRQGVGTFIVQAPERPAAGADAALMAELSALLDRASRAGLGPSDVRELVELALAEREGTMLARTGNTEEPKEACP